MHNFKLKGKFKINIVDELTKKIEKKFGWQDNLILNQGIDYIAQRSFAENILYCVLGAGTTPPLLTDTGLTNELQRSGTVDSSINNACQTTLIGNVYTIIKTFKMPTNYNSFTFGQIGWSYSQNPGDNLFSKALAKDSSGIPQNISVGAGKYIQVQYSLQIQLSPSSSTAGSANIPEWISNNGNYSMQLIGLKKINADGSIGYYDAGNDCNEPSGPGSFFIGQNSTALSAFGSAADRSVSTNYVKNLSNNYLGNGALIKQCSFGKTSAIDSSLRSMGIGAITNPQTNSGFVHVFDSMQTKDNGYILTLKNIMNWSAS